MSESTAISVLSARYGQLIELSRIRLHGHLIWQLFSLSYNGKWEYAKTHIDEDASLYRLVSRVLSMPKDVYDERFDIVSPQYIAECRAKRKAERPVKATCATDTLSHDGD